MSDSKLPDVTYVRELAKVFKQYGLDEVEIETGEQRVLLRRAGAAAATTVVTAAAPVAAAPVAAAAPATAPAAAAPTSAEASVEEGDFITSPFVGTFYARPKPEEPSFVKVGDTVAAGATVCIVEAMKLFNEIQTEESVEILEALVDDGKMVEFGAKLFRIRRA
jgi:acetyl-CoA carboxylase biotin carboxyl carrier protein